MQGMITRHLEKPLRRAATKYPALTLTGPRQSGKTTLVRHLFPKHAYVSLEAPDHRAFALEDPRGFLGQFEQGVILDEVQRAPDLFSYLQEKIDGQSVPGKYVLTGSQNFLLMARVGQSLAGRTAIFHLLPLSRGELLGVPPLAIEQVGRQTRRPQSDGRTLFETLLCGFYPRIHDQGLEPQQWLRNYFQTYVERDVRSLLNVGDIETFGRFVRLCAGRTGQLLNISSLGADCGISHDTARRWLSVMSGLRRGAWPGWGRGRGSARPAPPCGSIASRRAGLLLVQARRASAAVGTDFRRYCSGPLRMRALSGRRENPRRAWRPPRPKRPHPRAAAAPVPRRRRSPAAARSGTGALRA